MKKFLSLFVLLVLTACASSEVPPVEPEPEAVPQEEVSQEQAPVIPPPEPEVPVTYFTGVCGSEIPSTWHVRSEEDQAIWNTEGNIKPPAVLDAEEVIDRIRGWTPYFKPAVFSMADADTRLLGHAEDPGAEDANRPEVDIAVLPPSEMAKVLEDLALPPAEYAWSTATVGGHDIRVLTHVLEDSKYHGMEFYFVPSDITGRNSTYIIVNRSNGTDKEWNAPFRAGVRHFLATIDFTQCPANW